jgi:putative ABC transport system permease protein
MRTLLADFRFALRMSARTPGFTPLAVLALALGMGANTAVFSVIRGVLLRDLPYRDPGRLVAIWESKPRRPHPTRPKLACEF